MKLASSIAIYLAAMDWYWPAAIASERAKRPAAWILAGTMIFEMTVIFGQAARGVRSHFNYDTPMDGALFQLMGGAIVINVVTAAVFCNWTFRAPPSAYIWGIRLGLLLFVIFAFEGGMMAQRKAHSFGVPDGGPGLPILNWSTTGGDLRVADFAGMRALQLLPLIGFLTKSIPVVAAAFAVWCALAFTVFWRALAGLSLPIDLSRGEYCLGGAKKVPEPNRRSYSIKYAKYGLCGYKSHGQTNRRSPDCRRSTS